VCTRENEETEHRRERRTAKTVTDHFTNKIT